MKKSMNCITTLFMLLMTIYVSAFDNELTSICHRHGTDELYAGGEFNTIFVVNKKTGATTRQIKIATKVLDLQFNQSGSKLIYHDGSKVYLLNPETGEESYSFKAESIQLFENSPYMVNADWFSGMVTVYSTEDGSPVFEIKPDFDVLKTGLNEKRDQLIIVGREMEIKGEKDLIQEKIAPAEDYNVYNKAYVEQQEDEKGTSFLVFDINTKAELLRTILPYSPSASFGMSVSKYKEDFYISGWDAMLKIDKTGKAFPIQSDKATFAYATNATGNGQYILVSSTKDGFVYNCETKTIFGFDAKSDNEFSYSKDISYNGEEIYLLAADYTIAIMNGKGMVLKRFKIENSSAEGFGIYYYNGFTKKEARDKEAAVINATLTKWKMETIDLESAIGKSDFLIGVFQKLEDAEAFAKEMDDNGLEYITKIAPYSSEE